METNATLTNPRNSFAGLKQVCRKTFLLGLLISPLLLTACGKKSSDDPRPVSVAPVVVAVPGNFVNRLPGNANLLSNVPFAASYMQGVVNLNGTGNYDWNNPAAVQFYSGPLTLNGTLQVLNPSLCGAPVGTYNLVGQGGIQGGIVFNTTLTASGPVNLQIQIYQATLYNPQTTMDRNVQGNRLGIHMANLIVNGQPCGEVTSY